VGVEFILSHSFKRVLMACSNFWDSPIQVGDHQLARYLARSGASVSFLSAPISPLHIFARWTTDLATRVRNYRTGGMQDLDGQLWHYVPGALLVPHNVFPLDREWISENWFHFTVPSILRKLKGHGPFDLVYIRDPRFGFLLKQVEHKTAIYRMADKDSGFGSHNHALARLEQELAREVDAVVYTARSLEQHVRSLQPRHSIYLPNGIDTNNLIASPQLPKEYEAIPSPRAVYVGSMEDWFDFDLMNHLALTLTGVSFVLIGPDEKARARLHPRPNLHILGRRPQSIISGYLKHAQAGLIPFDRERHRELVDCINPIKLYEYFACGLPVVATEWEELRLISSPAMLSPDRDTFVRNLRRAIDQAPDRARFVEYARSQDISLRFQSMLDELVTHVNGRP
jgi:glycosyltransferase involved in cell wall biosynthesis